MGLIPCKHWRESKAIDGGECLIGAYRGPNFGVCLRVCEQYDGPERPDVATLEKRIKMRMTPCGKAAEKKLGKMA